MKAVQDFLSVEALQLLHPNVKCLSGKDQDSPGFVEGRGRVAEKFIVVGVDESRIWGQLACLFPWFGTRRAWTGFGDARSSQFF